MISTRKNDNIFLLIVVFTAFVARLAFYISDFNNPFRFFPIIDENEFFRTASDMAQNGLFPVSYFWHPPLYTFMLAVLLKLGFSVQGIVLLQMLMGIAGVVFFFLAAGSYDKKPAFIASLIWAVYPLQLFTESRLLSENLFIFLTLLFFFLFVRLEKSKLRYPLLALLAGLMMITRSQFIIFLIFWILFLVFYERMPLKRAAFIFLMALIFPSLAVFHNAYHTNGKLWFISANGPVNFYIGNSDNIEKTLNIRPLEWKESFFPGLYDEAGIYFSESDSQKQSYPYLLSGFLIKKTLKENTSFQTIFNNLLQKTVIALHAEETPRNYDLYEWREFNPYLKFTVFARPVAFPLSLIYFAAIIFMFVSWKKLMNHDYYRLVVLLILSGIIPSILFFNAFRYRLTFLPFLILFAVLFYQNHYKNIKFQITNILMIILLGTGLTASLLVQKIPVSETWRLAGDGWLNKKKYEQAEKCYLKSLKLTEKEENNALARKTIVKKLANLAILSGNRDKAAELLQQSGDSIVNDAEIVFAKALALYQKGIYNEAIRLYTKAISFRDSKITPQAYHGRALCFIRINKIREGFQDFDSAILLKNDYAEAWSNRGILKGQQGDTRGALADLNKAIELNPAYVKAYLNRSIAYLTLNQIPQAMLDLNTAIGLDSLNAQAYYLRGITQINSGNKSAGCKDLKKSLRLGFKQAEKDIEANCK
ncbi:MAG TPA: glycosyltransferase family 39 protein [Bacteroidia bacterium]|nr:glycosyltransferase family 39 protein [Bacteroidia bacterium]